MKRIAIFAHYDRDGLVDEYVRYYLRGLKGVAERILFVSDCALREGEAAKLDGLAELVWAGRHGEYDFGSWKRGFAHLGESLGAWDEVIVANDSCYAPLYPFEDAFARMAAAPYDAWSGMGSLDRGRIWLSSHFLVFRRPVLDDPEFRGFWPAIAPQPNPGEVVVRYEHGLSRLLQQRGYRLGALVPIDATLHVPYQGDYVRRLMPAYGAPWLKVKLLRDNHLRAVRLGDALKALDDRYPRHIIDAHQRRLTCTDDPPHYHFRLGTFNWRLGRGRLLRVFARTRRDRWWKLYVQLFGLTVFAFALPLPRRNSFGTSRLR